MQWLAAYTVPPVRAEALRQHLLTRLPAFMQPVRYVGLDALPLTPHGKPDLAALPSPVDAGEPGAIRNAPRDAVDQQLQRIWGRVLGVPELAADPRFAKNPARVANRGALDAVVGERLVARPVAEWVTTLNEAGVACGPIYTVDQVFADPQVRVAGLVHEHAHEAFGPVKVLGLPVALSRTPPTVRTPARNVGF